jgi:hypothetical protein
MKISSKIYIILFLIFTKSSFAQNIYSEKNTSQEEIKKCVITKQIIEQVVEELEKKNSDALKKIDPCYLNDHDLIFKASLVDPIQFQYAPKQMKEEENFVRRLAKADPYILQFASEKLTSDPVFMERLTYLNRGALRYADKTLLDNRLFMKKMIEIDAKNYMYASNRVKEMEDIAVTAFIDDGGLLIFAPDSVKNNKKLVKVAVESKNSALEYIGDDLKSNKEAMVEFEKIAYYQSSIKSKEELEKFLSKNYLVENRNKNLGWSIGNRAKFFAKNKIIDRNYVTKWQKKYDFSGSRVKIKLQLVSSEKRNYPIKWEEDFRKYPDLIKKIENFLSKHGISDNTIKNLYTTFFWKVKEKPLTFVFNLYLLRDNSDSDLGSDFCDITSLTAVAQKRNDKWTLTIIDVIFDNETKVDISYANGHKKYVFWDLYQVDKNDQNPKIIFKVEDKFQEYLKIFEETNNGKYQELYQITPSKNY